MESCDRGMMSKYKFFYRCSYPDVPNIPLQCGCQLPMSWRVFHDLFFFILNSSPSYRTHRPFINFFRKRLVLAHNKYEIIISFMEITFFKSDVLLFLYIYKILFQYLRKSINPNKLGAFHNYFRKSTMELNELQLKKLADDGLDVKLLQQNATYFESCPSCKEQFTQISPHILFTCGHVTCNQCYNDKVKCGYCKQQRSLKVQKYLGLLNIHKSTVKTNAEVHYDIFLQISVNHQGKMIPKVSSSMKFQSLLNLSEDFKNYESVLKDRVGVVIKSKHFPYKAIKSQCLADYSNILKTKGANIIAVLDSYKGGKNRE